MATRMCNPCAVYETSTCCQCRLMPCICPSPPQPCKIFMPPKPKHGICEDLRRLNFFNMVGNILTLLVVLFFLLTLLELMVFHCITSHKDRTDYDLDSAKDFQELQDLVDDARDKELDSLERDMLSKGGAFEGEKLCGQDEYQVPLAEGGFRCVSKGSLGSQSPVTETESRYQKQRSALAEEQGYGGDARYREQGYGGDARYRDKPVSGPEIPGFNVQEAAAGGQGPYGAAAGGQGLYGAAAGGQGPYGGLPQTQGYNVYPAEPPQSQSFDVRRGEQPHAQNLNVYQGEPSHAQTLYPRPGELGRSQGVLAHRGESPGQGVQGLRGGKMIFGLN